MQIVVRLSWDLTLKKLRNYHKLKSIGKENFNDRDKYMLLFSDMPYLVTNRSDIN